MTEDKSEFADQVNRIVARGALIRDQIEARRQGIDRLETDLEALADELIYLHSYDPASEEGDLLSEVVLSGKTYEDMLGQVMEVKRRADNAES